MSHDEMGDELEGKPDGSYAFTDKAGKRRVGWMPPALLKQILAMPGVRRVTPVRIQEPDGSIRDDFWPMADATSAKFADERGIVHVMSLFEEGEAKYYFVAKVVFENQAKIAEILMNPALSESEKHARMKDILKR